MLRIVETSETRDLVRLGMSTLFMRDFIRTQDVGSLSNVQLHTNHSSTIAKGLIAGVIDIACIFENSQLDPAIDDFLIDSFDDRLVWVRARDFVLPPGRPIPVLTWPGDVWMVRTLTLNGLSFRIVMDSSDFHLKAAAVEAGLGLTAVPSRMVPAGLVVADESYLPPLPAFRALLYQRPEANSAAAAQLRKQLSALFFKADGKAN